jgi:DNA-binding CsgD family transcriptional regulator
MLLGRRNERDALDALLDAVRLGESRALVVRGEAGVGKSALLEYLVESASGFRIERAVGVEGEMELPFAGLQQLCGPMLERLERLPGPQRNALDVAFGRSVGEAPDRFLVGLAALSLASEMADDRPLVCIVDDAQWLDRESAQALAFVARRLEAESVALVFAVREQGEELKGLPELLLRGLNDADARALLELVLPGPVDERVRERIVAETRGNPLALLELPRGLALGDLAGGFGLPDTTPLSDRIEESFRQRLAPLPASTRQLLLLAAAEPLGDPVLLFGGAQRLGIGPDAADAAKLEGLLEVGSQVTFRHPLVRSVVYRAASPHQRREVHGALADTTDPDADPDRRAWHLAQATLGPDEAVAEQLERSADRAQARGGFSAAAAFLERAAVLSPAPGRRAERALAAGRAKRLAGSPQAASTLLARAATGPLNERDTALLRRLQGQIALDLTRGDDAVALLLDAARRLEPLDAVLARETYLEAVWAATVARRGGRMLEVAQAVRAAPPAQQPPQSADLLLDALAVRFTDGYAASATILKHVLVAFRDDDDRNERDVRWPWQTDTVAAELFDDETWRVLAIRHVQIARDTGALGVLPQALTVLAALRILEGNFDFAAGLIEEADVISDATGNARIASARLLLAACRGDQASAALLIEARAREAIALGEGMALTISEHASVVLNNSLGRYEDAVRAAQHAQEYPDDLFSVWSLPELVEAAVRAGRTEIAADALESLSERAGAAATNWAFGVEARSRALLSEGQAADGLYREAIEMLSHTRVRIELARAHLVYGEWLRRERRRTDAREQLRIAHEMFSEMGAEAFAERAALELRATGEHARKRTADTRGQLTAQETQIARLAADGHSNPEIGAQLFISPRTVEYHLHKVFTKLAIASRGELQHVLPGDNDTLQALAGPQPGA